MITKIEKNYHDRCLQFYDILLSKLLLLCHELFHKFGIYEHLIQASIKDI